MANSSTLKSYLGISEAGPLIVQPVERESLALRLTTVVHTGGGTFRFPRITTDPSAAWIAENAEITVSEATADEVPVIPKKVAGLSIISNELANDTSPEAAGVIGDGLARDIARRVDQAFFGTAPANTNVQPGGLEYLGTTVENIDADPSAGIAAYIDALAAAEALGVTLSAFVTDPTTARALAKLTTGTGSNLPLFGVGATNGIERNVLGVPLHVSPYVLPGTAWGIPSDRVFAVLRDDVSLDIDKSVFFTKDQTAIRGIMRVGFGFVQPEAVIKIKAAA
ncbi:phage major capsid protein [Cryobacterium zongtaii]|uniref:Phage major capsid protein n=1 Tax=Cryobacterium zongtaii TaxID=1259217 RepID=A0A2S3ZJ53_9MICO|nr:phage major capsid protein [Cryobacterium zongtaii]POH67628.1 phage major capsid protein [Cryobacterium zongtaii]